MTACNLLDGDEVHVPCMLMDMVFPRRCVGEAEGIAELFEIYCGPKGVPAFSNLLD